MPPPAPCAKPSATCALASCQLLRHLGNHTSPGASTNAACFFPRYLLLQAMVATAMADGHMSDAEHATVGDVYQELMRCNVNSAELSRVVGEMQKAGLQVRLGAALSR